MLSENEARKKWCPHVRSVGWMNTSNAGYVVAGFNRDHPSGNIPTCVASACMAWRWAEEKPIRDIDLVTGDIEKTERLGYCGLSGKSEYGD